MGAGPRAGSQGELCVLLPAAQDDEGGKLNTGLPAGLRVRECYPVTRPVRDLDLTINFNMAVLRGAALSAAESEFVDYVVRVMQREG